mmetsp:Transcript_16378/g.35886  ORF Transcript_16378/g.35886 Transcript_16378/m.35886 type:complete len:255 (-) Transcript_16378:119-883(-)
MGVAKGLEDIDHGGGRRAAEVSLGAAPERLPKVHFSPRQVRKVPLSCLDRGIGPIDKGVALVDGHIVGVHVGGDVAPRPVGQGIERALAVLPDRKFDPLSSLVHPAACDEDIFLCLLQGPLEGFHLAHEVKIGRVHLLNIPELGHELFLRCDVCRLLPHGCLAILGFDKLGAFEGLREEVHGIDCNKVHAVQNCRTMLPHQRDKDIVGGQPGSRENYPLAIGWEVLGNVLLKLLNLWFPGGTGETCPARRLRQA